MNAIKHLVFPLLLSSILQGAQPETLPDGYTVETVNVPEGIVLSVGGLAFAANGDLFICTREGEVWRYREDQWHLFADGLHESLGVTVDEETGDLFVMQRGELTRISDENGDGTADLYETVNSAWGLTDNYHEYAFGPVRDKEGNFWGTLNTTLSWPGWAGSERWDIGRVHEGKMGRAALYRGWSFRITPDGKFEPWSSGLRSPAGIGANLEGEIFFTDNQGDWVGSSNLHHLKKGRFHGHPSSLMDHPDFKDKDLNKISVAEYDKMRTPPAVWLPHGDLSNSPGEPTVDSTGGKFGPFAGQFFIGDQSRSNIMRVALEKVNGEYQGVVFNFIHPMQSGCLRTAFGPNGDLWVGQTGRGWLSVGPKQFGLQRVVWDGKTIPMEMRSVNLLPEGFRISFTKPVGLEWASKQEAYRLSHFHYEYRSEYGSPKVNETKVKPTKVMVAEDGLSVELKLPVIAEKIYRITLDGIHGTDGSNFENATGWYTVNHLVK